MYLKYVYVCILDVYLSSYLKKWATFYDNFSNSGSLFITFPLLNTKKRSVEAYYLTKCASGWW